MLSSLDLRIQLGHDGGQCPCPVQGPQNFIVFDTSGAHPVNIDYCNCYSLSRRADCRVQLLQRQWFPATLVRPQTVFTFDCLDTFHELTLQDKGNISDFYHTILHKTDNTGLHKSIISKPPFDPHKVSTKAILDLISGVPLCVPSLAKHYDVETCREGP